MKRALLLFLLIVSYIIALNLSIKIHYQDETTHERYILAFHTKYQNFDAKNPTEKAALMDQSMRFISMRDVTAYGLTNEITTDWCLKIIRPLRGVQQEVPDGQIPTISFRVNPFIAQSNKCLSLSIDANTEYKPLQNIQSWRYGEQLQRELEIDIGRQHFGVLRPNPHVGIHSEITQQIMNGASKTTQIHINQQWWTTDSNVQTTLSDKFMEIFWQSEYETRVIGMRPLPQGFHWQLVPGTKLTENGFNTYLPVMMDTQRISHMLQINPPLTHLQYVQQYGYQEWIKVLRMQARAAARPQDNNVDGHGTANQFTQRLLNDVSALNVALEDECAICMENLELTSEQRDEYQLSGKLSFLKNCGHLYHQECWNQYVRSNPQNTKCAKCRQIVEAGSVEEETAQSLRHQAQPQPQQQQQQHGHADFSHLEAGDLQFIPEEQGSTAHDVIQQRAQQQAAAQERREQEEEEAQRLRQQRLSYGHIIHDNGGYDDFLRSRYENGHRHYEQPRIQTNLHYGDGMVGRAVEFYGNDDE